MMFNITTLSEVSEPKTFDESVATLQVTHQGNRWNYCWISGSWISEKTTFT